MASINTSNSSRARLGGVTLQRGRHEGASLHDDFEVAPTTTTTTTTTHADNQPNTRASIGQHRHGRYENSYKTEPDDRFESGDIERAAQAILTERLRDVTYEPNVCKQLSQELAAQIMDSIKSMPVKRYKLVAVVSIGSMTDRPGLQFGSRCLWNQNTDSFASIKFTNGSIFAVAMVYGLFYE